MKYQAYESYKDSGVEWLGEIPSHWDVVRAKWKFTTKKEINKNLQCLERLSLTMNGVLERSINSDEGLQPADFKSYQIFERNDLVFKLIDLENFKTSRVGLVHKKGIMSPAYIRLEATKNLNHKFFYYQYFNMYLLGVYNEIGGQGVRSALNASDLLEIEINYPPKEEQTKIADFLDYETAKIDKLIAKQERLIELLKEKRQGVISHAVTKGLDPNAPMKDSGVEWLGEIPKHWEFKKLKYVAKLLSDKKSVKNRKVIALENIEGFTGNFIESDSEFLGDGVTVDKNDILFGKLRPYLAKVYLTQETSVAFGDLLAYRPSKLMESHFLFYYMIFDAFIKIVDSSTYGTKMPRASSEFIGEMPILIPPKEEQIKIVNFILVELNKFDILISKAEKMIQMSKERRTALISSAVTGKIDVRHWQPPTHP